MAGPGGKDNDKSLVRQRLDKWLFAARFFRSRDLAVEVIEAGHLRINSQHCLKPGHGVALGDVLTFAQGSRIRVVRVVAFAVRRGPATQAQTLYVDLAAAAGTAPLE